MSRSYYKSSIINFLEENSESVLGKIVDQYDLNKQEIQQKNAWKKQIQILKNTLQGFEGEIYFEFSIPRMGKRVDNIIIIDNCIFITEFKIGASNFDKYAKNQVFDYALDMNHFHEGSHNKIIIPLLIADNASAYDNVYHKKVNNLYDVILSNKNTIRDTLKYSLKYFKNCSKQIDILNWEDSSYKPTPTIIEAATALFKKHTVEEISRSGANEKNLSLTSECISNIIDYSKNNKQKSICFVTGVPGAGKTLAGLNIANLRSNYEEEEHTVFLSGNGPLVDVLREALARDSVKTAKENNLSITKSSVTSKVKSFIQNIHHFRDTSLRDKKAPIEKVTIFDEAQRAWTKEQASKFMKRNKGIDDFEKSEPEFLIEVMNRHEDWCTIVCLIGGGQEINSGEAGLEEWIKPFSNNFPDWKIFYSSRIIEDKDYIKDISALSILNQRNAVKKDELHLSVSLRSFRSARLSNFVHEVINNNISLAKDIYLTSIEKYYPLRITRNLETAKQWLRDQANGSERIGIIASSGALRLRPYGLNVKAKIDAPIWFLNDKDDIRSSHFLEEVATQFDIQGLELDWACLAWDGNFFHHNNTWNFKNFKGSKWQNVIDKTNINYLINSYRVLLTRARQGMIIYIPYGSKDDITRPFYMYDGTYNLLKEIGIEEV